jgi:cytochrome c oxidase subunit IV
MKNPPILISVIGFFAMLAGFAWLFFGLRLLGFDWFTVLGDVPAFEEAGLWGWLYIIGGALWIAAAFGLWALQPWAWMLAMVVAGLALFEAVLYMIQYPGTGIGLAMSILPLIIILYLNGRDVKVQFGMKEPPPAA